MDRDRIEHAVARLIPSDRVVSIRPLTGGVSAEVLAVETDQGSELVFRQHRDTPFKGGTALAATEYALVRALWARGIAVPEPYLFDPGGDGDPPFLVTAMVPGTTAVTERELPTALEQMAAFLARLHGLDVGALSVPGLGELDDPLAELSRYLPDNDAGRAMAEAVAAGAVAAQSNDPALVHGDFWPGNVLWNGGRLAAVIDWEDAAIGDPIADLACARVELLCAHDEGAMDAFTAAYRRSCTDAGLDLCFAGLPVWEAYVSAAALATMAQWGLDPADEAERRARTDGFFARAVTDLLG